jgi:hypothetical protein
MKSKIQMRRAKHMIAIWMEPGNPESLVDALDTARRCWNRSSQRVLRVWAKELHRNPERYEFTGMATKSLKLTDHFNAEEIDTITKTVYHLNGADFDHIIRSIIQHKWVYRLSTEDAIKYGIEAYHGEGLKHRPAKPVLKPCK